MTLRPQAKETLGDRKSARARDVCRRDRARVRRAAAPLTGRANRASRRGLREGGDRLRRCGRQLRTGGRLARGSPNRNAADSARGPSAGRRHAAMRRAAGGSVRAKRSPARDRAGLRSAADRRRDRHRRRARAVGRARLRAASTWRRVESKRRAWPLCASCSTRPCASSRAIGARRCWRCLNLGTGRRPSGSRARRRRLRSSRHASPPVRRASAA